MGDRNPPNNTHGGAWGQFVYEHLPGINSVVVCETTGFQGQPGSCKAPPYAQDTQRVIAGSPDTADHTPLVCYRWERGGGGAGLSALRVMSPSMSECVWFLQNVG